MIFIYGIVRRGKVVYVGASLDPKRRLARKRVDFGDFTLTVKILAKATAADWAAKERRWIARLSPKLNNHPGGTGSPPWKPTITAAFREKKRSDMSKAWADPKKRKNLLKRNAARWSSPAQKVAHIARHLGAKRSAATRKKISDAARARIRYPHTEATKRKMRATWRRKRLERERGK